MTPSGGDHGPTKRFRDQVKRLFATSISCSWAEPGGPSAETGIRGVLGMPKGVVAMGIVIARGTLLSALGVTATVM